MLVLFGVWGLDKKNKMILFPVILVVASIVQIYTDIIYHYSHQQLKNKNDDFILIPTTMCFLKGNYHHD